MTDALRDKVAIVTGASSGIGEATAHRLAASGVRVVLAARRTERLETLATEIENRNGSALVVPTDVTDSHSTLRMARMANDTFGRIDILVNNAGIMPLSPIAKLQVDEWDRMIDVNVKGVLHCIAAVLPTMLDQGSGHIVNVSSVAGRRPFPSGTIYSASKFAVRAISQGLRLELSPTEKIRVTDVEPGVVATELMDHITDHETADRFKTNWGGKRALDPNDIAETILFVVAQPDHVNVNEILVRPTDQPT
jgi:NADP-dependent 3-hydroxy acid dehydrogenase YdfG